jgi:hypothetical protein
LSADSTAIDVSSTMPARMAGVKGAPFLSAPARRGAGLAIDP